MKKFKDVRTGVIETVTNEALIEQYEKHSDIYEEVKEKKADDKKTDEALIEQYEKHSDIYEEVKEKKADDKKTDGKKV